MLAAVRRSGLVLSSWCLAAACSFDSSGNGFPGGASVGESGDGSDESTGDASGDVDVPSPTTAVTTSPGEPHTTAGDVETSGRDTDPAGDDGTDTGGGDDSAVSHGGGDAEDDGDTGVPDACAEPVFDLYWVEDADVTSPMALVVADANDDPKVAYSTVAESGSVTVSIDFECAGEYTLWGLVWDYDPGAWGEPDPDSFYFDVGGAESTWRYGCQTGQSASGLSWQRMASLSAQPCEASYIVLQVFEAGTVELNLRNREAGSGNQVAGVAAIVVGSDPDADPATLYDPY